jgi:hypothetical protein
VNCRAGRAGSFAKPQKLYRLLAKLMKLTRLDGARFADRSVNGSHLDCGLDWLLCLLLCLHHVACM